MAARRQSVPEAQFFVFFFLPGGPEFYSRMPDSVVGEEGTTDRPADS